MLQCVDFKFRRIACGISQKASLTEARRSILKPSISRKVSGAACCVTNCIFNHACRNVGIDYAGLLSLGRIVRAKVGNVWKKAIVICAKPEIYVLGPKITTQIVSFQAEIRSSSSRIRFGMCCSIMLGERRVFRHCYCSKFGCVCAFFVFVVSEQ